MPRRRNNELSLKEKKFVKEYVTNGGNGAQAARKAYNTKPRNGATVANLTLKRPQVQEAIEVILNKKGLTLDDLAKYSKQIIKKGIEEGKPSFATAASMVQFGYKLHNVVPATKSVRASLSIKQELHTKNPQELEATLEKLHKLSGSLLEDIKS